MKGSCSFSIFHLVCFDITIFCVDVLQLRFLLSYQSIQVEKTQYELSFCFELIFFVCKQYFDELVGWTNVKSGLVMTILAPHTFGRINDKKDPEYPPVSYFYLFVFIYLLLTV